MLNRKEYEIKWILPKCKKNSQKSTLFNITNFQKETKPISTNIGFQTNTRYKS